MELYQLRYFARAAAYENISMAAQDLHVTQPSISKAVKALEKELQVELMRRNGKYCELTHEGRRFQARILPVLAELDEIPAEIQNRRARKQIRINVLSASFMMPSLIKKYRETHPDVFFTLLDRREAINWDICIRSTLPEVFFSNAVKLMDERLLFACKKGTELAEKERISLGDLTDVDFVVLKKGGSIRAVSDKKFKERGFIPRISYECDNHYILKRMVEEGLGVAIWPEYSWRRKLEEEDDGSSICLKPLDIAEFTRSLYLIRQKDVKLTENIEEFIEFTIDYFDMIKK